MIRFYDFKRFVYLLLTAMMISGVQGSAFDVNTSLKSSDVKTKIVYISPLPNADYIMPQTNIILRSSEELEKSSVEIPGIFFIKGSDSGSHPGKVILADDKRTILFQPYVPFESGERINVRLSKRIKTKTGKSLQDTSFSFTISHSSFSSDFKKKEMYKELIKTEQADNSGSSFPVVKNKNHRKIKGVKDLPVDFPEISVMQYNDPSPGYIFLSNFSILSENPYSNYLMIIKNSGEPVFYRKMKANCFDFKVQPTGLITYYDLKGMKFYGMNSSFAVVDSFACGSGYMTDVHELLVLPNGNYFLLADDFQKVDMSKIVPGGNPNATVMGIIIQELDRSGNIIFQWRSWDHFKISDATHEDLTAAKIDYVHSNAIEIDNDNTILLSSRHLDEITKIDLETGNIIWRLGGKNNQFNFTADDIGFSHQHAVRRLPNGDITLFDDGNFHDPPFSRGVEYKLDEKNMDAALVWQYRNNPDIYGAAMGYVQRFSNGNTLIGWGTASPSVTEVTPDGKVALELALPDGEWSYRAFKFPLIFLDSPVGGEKWKSGMENNITWTSSGVDSVNIDFSPDAGSTWTNIVQGFSGDSGSYEWKLPDISSSNCLIRISNASKLSLPYSVKSDSNFSIDSSLSVELTSFSSDVNSDTVRLNWTTQIEKNNLGFEILRRIGAENWRSIGFVAGQGTSTSAVNYSYTDQLDTTSLESSIFYRLKQIDLSGSSQYLKEVKLHINLIPGKYFLFNNYPNPFNPTTVIKYSLPFNSQVELNVYNVIGEKVKELINTVQSAGDHKILFNGIQFPSGVYFYALTAKSLGGSQSAYLAKKMILIK